MGFRTKLDYSDNRQIKQHVETLTHLSGATTFGVPFNQLPVGPDLNTSGITNTLTFVGSTFSGNNSVTIFTWYDDIMQLGYPYLSAITPSNSGTTQFVPDVYTAATTTIIDGNTVALSYTGVNYDLTAIAMFDLGGGDYSGTVVSNQLNFLSAGTLDFTGRTIWVDVSGTARTNKLIVTDGAVAGYVLTALDNQGTIGFGAGGGAGNVYWTAGTGTDAILMVNGGNTSSGNLSIAEGFGTQATGDYAHSEGIGTIASGTASHAEGRTSQALGTNAHAEGGTTFATGDYTHSEGFGSLASGLTSHAEGTNTIAGGSYAHSEGNTTIASGDSSHAEGQITQAIGLVSHAEGISTQAIGDYSHAEGNMTIASGYSSHAQGISTQAIGTSSHAEGFGGIASGSASHVEGQLTYGSGDFSHAEGEQTEARGKWSHVEGIFGLSIGLASHTEGSGSTAIGNYSHAEGVNTIASGQASHAEGRFTHANGIYSHAGGFSTNANGISSFVHGTGSSVNGNFSIVLGRNITGNTADTTYVDRLNIKNIPIGTSINNLGIDVNGFVVVGLGSGTTIAGYWTGSTGLNSLIPYYNTTIASGDYSIATGNLTEATGDTSTAEGYGSKAYGIASHAEGQFSIANGNASHAEGFSITFNDYSHGEGAQTIASGYCSHAQGYGTTALTAYDHTQGYLTIASGGAAHASGEITMAIGASAYVGGIFSIASGVTSFVHGSASTANGDYINILGSNITGTTPHTTYVENLKLKTGGTLSIGAVNVDAPTLQLTSASLSTGLYLFSNSGITITAATATTFNLGAARGWIVDSGDVLNANPIFVSYSGGSGLTTPYMVSSPASYLLINSASTLTIINTKPTTTQRRQNIYLGAVGHPNLVIDSFGNEPDIIMNEMSQVRAMFDPINLINDGVIPYANGINLALANTTGRLFGLGIGFITNGNYSPTVVSVPAGAPTTFQYRTQNSASTTNTTLIDPTTYDNAGIATSIGGSNNQATNQRVYLLVDGSIRVQYGQTIYGTISAAKEGASTESFTAFPNNTNLGILIGMISIRKGGSNLANTGDAIFLPVSKFGETVGAAGGVSTATLQSAYNNSGAPEIVTNSTLLGVTIKRGSTTDTDYILVGQNGSGTPTFGVNGNGAVTANTMTLSNITGVPTGILGFDANNKIVNYGSLTFFTGGTFSANTATFTNNTGGTFSLTGLTVNNYTTGTTLVGNNLYFNRNDTLSAYTVNLSAFSTDTYVTGFTYSSNTFTIKQNNGQPDLSVLVNTMTGLTINGNLTITGATTGSSITATTISSTTLTVSGVTYNKLLLEKVGFVSGSTFAGNPKTASVTFTSNFPNTNYAIVVNGEDERSWTSSNKTISGFTINANTNSSFTGLVYWIAKQYGEV